MIYFLVFIVSFLVVILCTPFVRLAALRLDIIDKRNHRTVHNKVITKMGGLSIFAGVAFSIIVAYLLEYSQLRDSTYSICAIFVGAALIVLLGVFDDIRGANAKVKFAVQIVAALILCRAGFVIYEVSTPWGLISLGQFSLPFTVLWIIGITNAINLIDGLDGLASGVVALVSFCLFLIFIYVANNLLGAVLSVSLLGACLAFLRYNFFPAKIFMGDTGSLFLGYILAALSIVCSCKSITTVSILLPVIALGVPISDTSFAFLRRIIAFKHPFQADSSHFHHILIKKGFSHSRAVLVIYSITFVLSLTAVCLSFL